MELFDYAVVVLIAPVAYSAAVAATLALIASRFSLRACNGGRHAGLGLAAGALTAERVDAIAQLAGREPPLARAA